MIEKTETFYCKICFNSYDDKSKIPKVISCGHTMCSQCLEKFISETGNVFNTYESHLVEQCGGLLRYHTRC